MRFTGSKALSAAALVMVVGVSWAKDSRAQCSLGTCDSTYCEINCPTTADYLMFGSIWAQSSPGGLYTWRGIGVCRSYIDSSYVRGNYRDYVATWTNTADYRVRADGTGGSSSSDDLLRLADPDGEWCRTASPSVAGVVIYGALPDASDTFLFWGDAGEDKLYLCSHVGDDTPAAGDCRFGGRADGRSGGDRVYGSVYEDSLWGGSGIDYLYGWDGGDTLRGGPDNDWIWGHEGCDYLYGDDGGDDHCSCGPGDELEGLAYTCENYSSNCDGCFGKGDEGDEEVPCDGTVPIDGEADDDGDAVSAGADAG